MKRKWNRKLWLILLGVCLSLLMAFPALAEGETKLSVKIPVQMKLGKFLPDVPDDFIIRLKADDSSYPMPDGSENGESRLTISGAGTGEFVIETDQAGVYTYTISQIAGDNKDCIYDTSSYRLTVYVTYENGEKVISAVLETADGKEKPDQAVFENIYAAPGINDPPVEKVIEGDDPEEDSVFSFELAAVSNTAGVEQNPMPEGAENGKLTVSVTGEEQKEFGNIEFKKSGTYVYTISEIDTKLPGYTYDTSIYTVTYDVVRQDDALVVTRTVVKNSEAYDGDFFVFTNTYTKEPESESESDDEKKDSSKSGKSDKDVKTGDDTPLSLWVASLLCSMILIILAAAFVLRYQRSRRADR